MNEQQFRAAVEAAVRRLVEGDGEGITAPSAIVEDIIEAGNDYASDRYSAGRTDGTHDEREAHFG